ncbi:MAG: transcriptional repressor NrdR [Clostridia bacterium]|nr:transcriptional repressor NrdR [Clostridia bacterium]
MKCPSCGCIDNSKVVDSRPTEDYSIRRRRECLECHKRFTTYEIIDEVPISVIKKNKTKEIFDPNKIISGLRRACYKRPVSEVQIAGIVSEIEADISNSLKREVTSAELGNMVMAKLKEIDEVSYVRFASVYREFKDVETFLRELKMLTENKQ